ncbi:MAG: SUMF1/EgtB/PvdO family nonheme iron enzyme [Treponema sp.]|nr:SUMF1/EgtB/PvdO family nonheme iron enzyme [Treponema sp.]
MVCSKCGFQLADNFNFCPICGIPVIKAAQQANTQFAPAKTNKTPYMIEVQGGSFLMGDKNVNRKVSLVNFLLSETLITQMQYEYVIGKNPSKMQGPNRPVEGVTWYDAIIYCNTLSMMQNLHPCYSIGNITDFRSIDAKSPMWKRILCNFTSNGYRLPTEAEWEYAAIGGKNNSPFLYSGSEIISTVAWYGENAEIATHDVGTKAPNKLGFYDMSGNVAEWCWDYMGDLSTQHQTNPHGPQTGTIRVKRGGSWLDDPQQCTVYYRSGSSPIGKSSNLGFRVCRSSIENIM